MKKVLLVLTAVVLIFAISGVAETGVYGPLGGRAAIFPYIIKDDPNMTTIISLIVPNGDGNNNDAAELHYVYLYKDTAAAQTGACEEYDFKGATSPNDLVTFDVSGAMFGDAAGEEGLPLFNDTTSDPLIAGSTLALTVDASEGFLLVEVLNSDNGTSGSLRSPTGEALILDIANGGAWGYRAFNGGYDHSEQCILCSNWAGGTIIYPTDIADTEFIITPVNNGVVGWNGGYDSADLKDMTVVVKVISNDNALAAIYDRNENTLSATREQKVTCVGVATLEDLLSSGILNNTAFMAQGGWAYLWNKDPNTDAFIYKVESSSDLGSFMINGMPNGGNSIWP